MKKQLTLLWIAGLCAGASAFANDSTYMALPPSGIKVPDGFKVNVLAQGLGSTRHIAVSSNGNIYVKLANAKAGKGILELKSGTAGKTTVATGFGNYGGTGIAIKNG